MIVKMQQHTHTRVRRNPPKCCPFSSFCWPESTFVGFSNAFRRILYNSFLIIQYYFFFFSPLFFYLSLSLSFGARCYISDRSWFQRIYLTYSDRYANGLFFYLFLLLLFSSKFALFPISFYLAFIWFHFYVRLSVLI